MAPVRGRFLLLLLTVSLLAGCLGGDEDIVDPADDGGAAPTGDTGSVTGVVITVDIDPVPGAQISLVDSGNELAGTTTTKEDGSYVLNGVLPGQYRVQVSAICCRGQAEFVTVVAGQTAEVRFMLEPFSDLDLQIPYGIYDEYTGFMACQVTLPTGYSSGCGVVADNRPETAVGAGMGVRTFVTALRWSSPEQLELRVINPPEDYLYGSEVGDSPLEIRIDNDDIEDPRARFDAYDEKSLQFQLQARPAPNVFVYQVPLEFYWYLHYWERAPDGIIVVPDA